MCCRFMITQFITVRLMARIPLQIGDDPSALASMHLCVNFHKSVNSVAF